MTRQRTARLIASVATAAVAAGGIGLAPATAADTSSSLVTVSFTAGKIQDAEQDGKDLFRGVFFMQGEVAEDLIAQGVLEPTKGALDVNRSSKAAAVIDRFVEQMDRADPTFFPTLSAQLRSGDPFQVEAGLMAGTDLLNQVAPVATGGDQATAGAVLVVVVVFVAIAVAATFGATVHHSAAVLEVVVYSREVIMGGRALDSERQIAALTRALATDGTGARG